MSEMSMSGTGYPVRFDVAYPEAPNRWLILVRWLLAIPHFIVLYLLAILLLFVWIIAFFTILFAKSFPDGMYRFVVGTTRWSLNVTAYVLFLDRYPPFSMDEGAYPAVTFEVDKPEEFNRWLVLVKWLLVLPHALILAVLQFIAYFAGLAMVVAVLVTGRYPRGLFDFLVGVGRWNARVNAYSYFLVDRYPPFSLK